MSGSKRSFRLKPCLFYAFAGCVEIGKKFAPETFKHHKNQCRQKGFSLPTVSRDHSKQYGQLAVLVTGELINTTELCKRLANNPSTHVLQLEECERVTFVDNWRQSFPDVNLLMHTGDQRHMLIPRDGTIRELREHIERIKKEPNRELIDVRYEVNRAKGIKTNIRESNTDDTEAEVAYTINQWAKGQKPDLMIVGPSTKESQKLKSENQ